MECKNYSVCGGCSLLDVPYMQQLERKDTEIRLIAEKNKIDTGIIAKILPSPVKIYYRNKMEFVFSKGDKGSIAIGLRKKDRYNEVVNIEECKLFSQKTQGILDTARKWAVDNNISAYDLDKESGILRYLVLRESKHTGQVMVNLVIAMSQYMFQYDFRPKALKLAGMLERAGINLACFTVGLNEKKTDSALAENNYLLQGKEYIEEKIGKLSYAVYPHTFFQVNSLACEKLYDTVRSFALPYAGSTAIDLYCGSGGITLYVSDIFEKMIGVEVNKAATENASFNAKLNNIKNCEFVCAQAEDLLKKIDISTFRIKLSTLIVDPPRPGLAKKAIASIIAINPISIIYVSCKFETMIRDLQILSQYYKITNIQPVDMFPHTPHAELVAALVHK